MQGSCGSCWAFATVEQVESYAAINNISVPELSTQEVNIGFNICHKIRHVFELKQRCILCIIFTID